MTFGEAFRLRRTAQGWSIHRLAKAMKISSAEICRVEQGHLNPWHGDKIASLCEVMGCPERVEFLKGIALQQMGSKKGWV
jgi:transcriptional regulator with XRE-family HTH domain